MENRIERLLNWLDESTCNFRAIDVMKKELDRKGFVEIKQEDAWNINPGSRHYIVKNESAIFAFIAGDGKPGESGFRIISAHSDSPCLKIKPSPEIYGDGGSGKPECGKIWRRHSLHMV